MTEVAEECETEKGSLLSLHFGQKILHVVKEECKFGRVTVAAAVPGPALLLVHGQPERSHVIVSGRLLEPFGHVVEGCDLGVVLGKHGDVSLTREIPP